MLAYGSTFAQANNTRLSKAEATTVVSPLKEADTKAKADVLYDKTTAGQDKTLMFRQSVLEESNTNTEDQRGMMPLEEKQQLLNNKKTTTKQKTNKQPN